MAALATTATAFQIVSGVCDANSLIGTNDSLLKGLVPSSNEQHIAVIFATLNQTCDVLGELSELVQARGTREHQMQFDAVYDEYMRQNRRLNKLEAKHGLTSSKTWLTVLRLDFLNSTSKSLRSLHQDVTKNKVLAIRTSKDIRDALMRRPVSIIPSSAVESDTPAGAGQSRASVNSITPTTNSPAEVQLFKVITTNPSRSSEKHSSPAGSSMGAGAPLRRVDSTESWFACEMQGAVPLKKWTQELSDVLATNTTLPCGV